MTRQDRYDLLTTPRRAGLCAGRSTGLDVLVRLQAPDTPPEGVPRRQHHLNLAFVIDRSGSMSGPPLHEAKRCVLHMVDNLRLTDRAACVVYDDHVDYLVPSAPVDDPGRFARALARVDAGGTTDLHGGWRQGAGQLADTLGDEQIARVILLSVATQTTGTPLSTPSPGSAPSWPARGSPPRPTVWAGTSTRT